MTTMLSFALFFATQADDPAKAASIEFVQKLQTNTGGFLSMPPAPNIRIVPTLRATSTAVRALGYLGGKIPSPDAAAKFVASCYDATSGGFSDMPGGKADVFTTAVGIMAVRDLKMPLEKYADGVVKYLSENAPNFEDIRIAAAGLERLERKSAKNEQWVALLRKMQNDDGTFGKGPGQARETASGVVTLLRLGTPVEGSKMVLKALRDGQRECGGFGKADSTVDADLETSYRVMRCFMMLKEKPARVEGLRTYVAKCRNEDGGFGLAPGQTSTVGGTYFATIIRKWLDD